METNPLHSMIPALSNPSLSCYKKYVENHRAHNVSDTQPLAHWLVHYCELVFACACVFMHVCTYNGPIPHGFPLLLQSNQSLLKPPLQLAKMPRTLQRRPSRARMLLLSGTLLITGLSTFRTWRPLLHGSNCTSTSCTTAWISSPVPSKRWPRWRGTLLLSCWNPSGPRQSNSGV